MIAIPCGLKRVSNKVRERIPDHHGERVKQAQMSADRDRAPNLDADRPTADPQRYDLSRFAIAPSPRPTAKTAGAKDHPPSIREPVSPQGMPVQREVFDSSSDTLSAQDAAALRSFAAGVDKTVQKAVDYIISNPSLDGLDISSGYLTLWVRTYQAYLKDPSEKPDFFHARFGYAVETIACAMLPHPGSDFSIGLQVAAGATRPDIVVYRGKEQMAWLDITSTKDHIDKKNHSGWGTRPYVAEIIYKQPQPEDLKKGALDAETVKRIADAKESKAVKDKDVAAAKTYLMDLLDDILRSAVEKKGKGLSIEERTSIITHTVRDSFSKKVGELELARSDIGLILASLDEFAGATGKAWAKEVSGSTGKSGGATFLALLGEQLGGGGHGQDEKNAMGERDK